MIYSQPCRNIHLANFWPSTVCSARAAGVGSGRFIPEPSASSARRVGPSLCHMASTGASKVKPAPPELWEKKKMSIPCIQVFST